MYLRCFVHACPKKWLDWISFVEIWYNTSYHSTLKKSPFEVLYGHTPRHFGVIDSSSCASADLTTWMQNQELMTKLLRQHLNRANQRMKFQVDKKRSERNFAPQDWVFLKLQPYVQSLHHELTTN